MRSNVIPINPHDRTIDLCFVIDTLTGEAIEPGQDVHTATWTGTYVGLLNGSRVQVTDRTGHVGSYHPAQFSLAVTAMASCGCTVTNGIRRPSPDCRWP